MKKHEMKFRNRKTGERWTGYVPQFDEKYFWSHDTTGWCIACGNEQGNCEPDARQYQCEGCGKFKVYGLEELALRNWVHA